MEEKNDDFFNAKKHLSSVPNDPSRATNEAVKPSRAMLESDLKTTVKALEELVMAGGKLLPQNLPMEVKLFLALPS